MKYNAVKVDVVIASGSSPLELAQRLGMMVTADGHIYYDCHVSSVYYNPELWTIEGALKDYINTRNIITKDMKLIIRIEDEE